MKNSHYFLYLLLLLCSTKLFAQSGVLTDSIVVNKWSVEFNVGRVNPLEPFGDGFISNVGLKKTAIKNFNFFRIGTRYMFGQNVGLNLGFYHEGIKGFNKKNDIKFDNKQYGVNLSIVLGLGRILKLQEISQNFNVYVYTGFLFSKFKIDYTHDKLIEDNFGYNLGITPMYRLNEYMSIKTDFSFNNYLSQNRTWDGMNYNSGLDSKSFNYSVGLVFYLDNNKEHADWYIKKSKDIQNDKIISLDKRLGDVEVMMNDVDRDGVMDYLDFENNTPGGVKVDTRGRFIDENKNGVPDDMEKKRGDNNERVNFSLENDAFASLLEKGLINIFYNINDYKPNTSSVSNVYMLFKYLQTNKQIKIKLIGYTDSTGSNDYNEELSKRRVEYIKSFLIQKGIDEGRVFIQPHGVENDGFVDGKYSRRVSVYLIE